MAETAGSDRAPKGFWSSAHLVCDYFAVEHRTYEPIKWRVRNPRRAKLNRLARQAAKYRSIVEDASRHRAGWPIVGPLPLPEARPQRPAPATVHGPRVDFRPVKVDDLGWYRRSGLHRRDADLSPLFTCVGLEA